GRRVQREKAAVKVDETIDASVISKKQLGSFIEQTIAAVQGTGALLSLHLKATMMKVSDPIMFGQVVSVFYADALNKHADTLKQLGVDLNNGLGDLYAKIKSLPADKQAEIEADIKAVYAKRPPLAMV